MIRSRHATTFAPTIRGVALGAAALGFFAAPSFGQSIAEFYKGKQITMIVGSSTGGGYDAQGRLVARHLGKHIAGNPGFIVQNMPGAGSLQAANHLYNLAAKDGSVMGIIQRGMLTAKLTNPQGVRFEVEKFNWIGNLASETAVTVVWHDSPIKTVEDLFAKETIVGGTGPTIDTETTPRLYNALIGTKFRIIGGYPGTNEVLLAMERGEVMGLGDWSWSNVKTRRPEYLAEKKIRVLMQGALQKEADLPDVPLALDFVKNADDRKIMELFLAQKAVARPVVAPPEIPAPRVAALRAAFMAMAKDPEFIADAGKTKLEIDITSGESVDAVVKRIVSTPQALADRLADAIAAPAK
jgi:tripartite-type tricarboxylate transporter receptor subunit TctC